jgi:prepilin-type processing-associated H-X9-DG protein
MDSMFYRWLGASIVILGLISSAASADEPKSQQVPSELAWVPSNCTGFVHIRFAELWDGPLGRNARKILATSEPQAFENIEKSLGISLSQIDQVTIVLPEFAPGMANPPFVARITTTEAFDPQRLVSSLGASPEDGGPQQAKISGMYKLRNGGAIHLTGPRALTFFESEQSAISLLSRMLSAPAGEGISPALRQAAEKHQIVAGLDVQQLPKLPAEGVPPELLPLRDTKRIILVGDFNEEHAKLDIRLAYERNGHAAEAMRALEDGRRIAQEMLTKLAQDLPKDEEESKAVLAFLKDLQGALKDAKLKHLETEVQLVAEVQTASSLSTMLAHAAGMMKISSNRIKSQNNLKQIGLSFHNYNDTYGRLPAQAICDPNGKPLLSWRVAILPYIEQDQLYRQFKLDESWDSEHNKKLITLMPETYKLPGDKAKHELASTYYQVFVGPHAAFEFPQKGDFKQVGLTIGRTLMPASFLDGTSNTIWLAEAATAVPWTKPDDLTYDPNKAPPKLGYFFNNRCNVGFADGSVRGLRKDLKDDIWHLLIQRDDGQVLPPDFDK